MNIGDRIQLGDIKHMINSFIPEQYANKFATITEIYSNNLVICKVDDNGKSWLINTEDFIIISSIAMPQKEDLFEFLSG